MYPTVRGLALALTIAISIILAGFGSARAAGKSKTALVEIGFLGVPPPHFQNVLLNVQAIRINPNASAAPNDPKWQKIGVPAGIGQGGGNATPELQIDLNTSQNIPQLFNTGKVKPDTYKIAQLILDPNNPGTLVPDCPSAGTPEGCINYPIQLANPGSPINLIGSPLLPTSKGKLASLVMQLQMAVNTIPVQPGGAYIVTISLAPVMTPVVGTVTGMNVPTGSGGRAKHARKLAVTAEAIGTNTEIASAPVDNNGNYTLVLPAASGPDVLSSFGTLYDLALADGGDSYGAIRLEPLTPGQGIAAPDFTGILTNQTLGSISGTIIDNCTQAPIAGATIQLLIPPSNNTSVLPAACLDPTTFGQCVSVATANTNNAGDFPFPGSLTIPAAFDSVPILKSGTYTMMVSAPGYDSFLTPVNATSGKKSGGNCSSSKTVVPCKIALTSGSISGTILIDSPRPGQTTLVQVFAEDHGTNNIVSALPMPVIVRSTSGNAVDFTINVPTVPFPPAAVRTFDLFATTIDLFQGVTDPYQGHTIAVIKGVDGPTKPALGVCATPVVGITSSDTIRCVGHGSMVGSVASANANLGTSVVLSKNDVQITNAAVQNQAPNVPSTNVFSFCVPGDTYKVQRLQLPKPEAGVTPSVMPVPVLDTMQVTVTVPPAPVVGGPTPTSGPTPTATPTPTLKCPTTCSNPDGTCPGVCNNALLGQVL